MYGTKWFGMSSQVLNLWKHDFNTASLMENPIFMCLNHNSLNKFPKYILKHVFK